MSCPAATQAVTTPPAGQTWRNYYYAAGGQRIAMRVRTNSTNVVYYLHADHLGSTSLATDASGTVVGRQWYDPYGGERASSGALSTDRLYTGQRWDAALGLYDYCARWYDPSLGRFVSADTVVPNPGNPQDLNRYSYVRNNALRFVDPTGYFSDEEIMGFFGVDTWDAVLALFQRGGALEGQWAWLKALHMASEGDALQIYHYWNGVSWSPVEILGIPLGAVTEGKEPPALFMLFEGHFGLSEAGELYISGMRSWNHPCELSIFEAGQMGNSYAVFAHNTYSGRYYEQKTPNPGGGRWMHVGAAWPGGGYPDRWEIAPDWYGLFLDAGGAASQAFGVWWGEWVFGGFSVVHDVEAIEMGERGAGTSLLVDAAGFIPYVGGVFDAISFVGNLNIRNIR